MIFLLYTFLFSSRGGIWAWQEINENPLNGINLQCLPKEAPGMMEMKRNESGFITETFGVLPELIDWLSLKYSFTYTLLPDVAVHSDDSQFGRGSISYVLSGEADLILSGNPAIASRMRIVDFSSAWTDTPVGVLIPFPIRKNHLTAIVKPFEWKVWILFFFSILLMVLALSVVSHFWQVRLKTSAKKKNKSNNRNYFKVTDYVAHVIFWQGAVCPSRKLATRILAGTWCLACFVIFTAYSSVLISYIVAPNLKPIIDSANDIPKVPGLKMVVEKGATMEMMFLNVHDGIFQYVGDQLRADPSLRCNSIQHCFDRVRTENRVYPNVMASLVRLINEDHRLSGKCDRFTIAKEPLVTAQMCLILRKNSPYTDLINKGILEMKQYGLVKHWEDKYYPQLDKCHGNSNKKPLPQRISLNNLGGAFLALAIGYALALFVFIVEQIVHYYRSYHIPFECPFKLISLTKFKTKFYYSNRTGK